MMKKLFLTMLMPIMVCAVSCSAEEQRLVNNNDLGNILDGDTKVLIAYFSAEGHTRAVAEAIQKETEADLFFIEPAEPYAENPYDDSDKIQNEAYNDLRPEVKVLLTEEQMAKYDVIFVGTPCWWHQPAMVVCTFLEHYELADKTIIPFVTFGARTYLNETMQKLYQCTPNSRHIPEVLPEDLEPDNIRQPQNDDAGIDMPTAGTVRQWLDRIGYFQFLSDVPSLPYPEKSVGTGIFSLSGIKLGIVPEKLCVMNGTKYWVSKNVI